MGWTTEKLEFESRQGQEFSLLHALGVKQQGREADHSPPTSSEVKKMWIYTSTPQYTFMA
jgi:hypothetical protein